MFKGFKVYIPEIKKLEDSKKPLYNNNLGVYLKEYTFNAEVGGQFIKEAIGILVQEIQSNKLTEYIEQEATRVVAVKNIVTSANTTLSRAHVDTWVKSLSLGSVQEYELPVDYFMSILRKIPSGTEHQNS